MSPSGSDKPKKKKKKNYLEEPVVPPEMQERYLTTIEAITGQTTVSEAARRLGLSRVHFQTLMHRAEHAMLDALTPKPAGRPPKSPREAELEETSLRLERENAFLRERVETIDRLLHVAGDLVKRRANARGRTTRKKAKEAPEGGEDPDAEIRRVLEQVELMRRDGLPAELAAAFAGMSASTIRRLRRRLRRNEPLRRRRGPRPAAASIAAAGAAAEVIDHARAFVRETKGGIGAEALRRSVPGLSRRRAAAIKAQECTAMERERRAACTRVVITTPGVLRGFDALHVTTKEGRRYALAAADGSVPYRTTVALVRAYDTAAVVETLARDFAEHGPPLVLRLDRAAVHRHEDVVELMRARGVLALHGPPRCPRYYGQLERMNRDQRWWTNAVGMMSDAELAAEYERMRHTLNERWPRRALAWGTPAQAWTARPPLTDDRQMLREEVTEGAARLRENRREQRLSEDMIERLAVEQALTNRGYIRFEIAGWC